MGFRLIFVYGSLCSGEAAHSRLEGADFVGEAWSRASYTLLDLGPYPGLVASGQTRVRGELYRVSESLLRELDLYEGHPDEFVRSRVYLESDDPAEGYLWAGGSLGRTVVESGDWRFRACGRGRARRPREGVFQSDRSRRDTLGF